MNARLFFALFLCLILPLSSTAARRVKYSPRAPSTIHVDDALQKIVFYEDRRLSKSDFLVRSLNHPSNRVRKAALLALGRIGDSIGLDEMARILTRKDVEMRTAAAFALSLIPDDTAGKILSQNFPMHKDAETRAALIENMGRTGGEATVKLLSDTLGAEPNSRIFASLYESLGLLWSRDSESWAVPVGLMSKLARAAQSRGPDATVAAFALARFKGAGAQLPADDIVLAATQATSEFPRAFLSRVLGKIRTPASHGILIKGATNLSSLPLRVESVKALGLHEPTTESLQALTTALSDPSQHVVFEALVAVGKHGPKAAKLSTPLLTVWSNSRSTWIKGTALKALALVDPVVAKTEITRTLTNPASPNFADAVLALGTVVESPDLPQLTTFLESPDLLVAAAAGEAFSQIEDAKITPEARVALKKSLDRADANLTTLVAQMSAQHQWKDFAPALAAQYPKLTAVEHLEAKVAVLTTLGILGDSTTANLVLGAIQDKEKQIVEAAVKSYRTLTGKNLSDRIPLNSKVDTPSPLLSAMNGAQRMRVVVKTTRGEIHLKMLPEAAVTALNFVRLVKTGFYQNRTFHRIVPNFVIQGGDPRGDGFGGPGYFIRDEVSNRKHERGTVGIATAGKDTGGSQFFINLAPNFHLNGRYTVFAEVTQGMAVADKLEAGDKILSARAY